MPTSTVSLQDKLRCNCCKEVDYINFYSGHFPLQFIVHPSSFLLVIEITMMRMTTMRTARMMPPMMNFHLRFLQHIFQWTSLAFSLNTWAILSRFSARLSSSLSFPPRSCNLMALSRKVFVTSSTWGMVVQKVIPCQTFSATAAPLQDEKFQCSHLSLGLLEPVGVGGARVVLVVKGAHLGVVVMRWDTCAEQHKMTISPLLSFEEKFR